MNFDEQHGWVECGTRGHRASAQGVDVDAEVAALDRIHAHPIHDASYVKWRRREVEWWGSTVSELRALADARPARPARRADRNGPEITRAIQRRALRARVYAGFDVGQDGATAFTTYAVEGDTLRIVHTARMPLPAQTVNVTMTIGGE